MPDDERAWRAQLARERTTPPRRREKDGMAEVK
jgi:hypothetical protein